MSRQVLGLPSETYMKKGIWMSLDCTGILCDEHVSPFQNKPVYHKKQSFYLGFFLYYLKHLQEDLKEKLFFWHILSHPNYIYAGKKLL